MRWDPEGSRPGTVVVPIMYHSIRDPSRMVQDNVTVSSDYFQATVDRARALGFETITTAELIQFLTENARIPPRSMMLIIDDRRPGVVAENLLPVAEAFDWTVTLGWIIGDTGPDLWSTMEGLAESGRLDVQSHGLKHQYIVEQTPEDEIRQEIAGPIPILEQHFGTRPLAFVWPGGNFTARSAEIARRGHRIASPPSAAAAALQLIRGEAERVSHPLMVLQRVEPVGDCQLGAGGALRRGSSHAAENWAAEAAWFREACGGELPSP
jgi:peptidoglycan/xylan/chitin deacetylase (PgdA/CDA1 family)